MDGGGGIDAVDYSWRTKPVSADLAAPRADGDTGENDTIRQPRRRLRRRGQRRADGNAARRRPRGRRRQRPDPRPGWRGLVDGGAGNDEIETDDGARDEIDCGPGADLVWRDPIDTATTDCDAVADRPKAVKGILPIPPPTPVAPNRISPSRPRPPVQPLDRIAPTVTLKGATRVRQATFRRWSLELSLRCNELCGATAQLKGKRGVVATGALKQLALGPRMLRVKLTTAGRRALRTGKYELTVTVTDGAGNARRVVRTVRVT